jgi:hypothetical protein
MKIGLIKSKVLMATGVEILTCVPGFGGTEVFEAWFRNPTKCRSWLQIFYN